MNNPLESSHASPEASLGFMLWRVTNQWQAAIRRALGDHHLTHVQYVLLATLTWNNTAEGITQKHLSHLTHTDPMMVSQVVRALEGKNLLTRTPDPRDARAIRLKPTAAGQRIAIDATRSVEAADETFFGQGAASHTSLMNHLRQLDKNTAEPS